MISTSDSSAGKPWRGKLYPALPLVLWVLLAALTTYLFPRLSSFRFSDYRLGSVSTKEIVAPFTFDILKSDEEYKREREEARNAVEPVFVQDDSVSLRERAMLKEYLTAVHSVAERLKEGVNGDSLNADSLSFDTWRDLRARYAVNLTYPSWQYMLKMLQRKKGPEAEVFSANTLTGILKDLFASGILDSSRDKLESSSKMVLLIVEGEEVRREVGSLLDLKNARIEARLRLRELTGDAGGTDQDSLVKVSYELLLPFIVPNLLYDSIETEQRRSEAESKVPRVKGIVLKDERIIDSGEVFTKWHLEKLKSMEKRRAEIAAEQGVVNRIIPWVAQFFLTGLIYFAFGFWLARFRKDVFFKPNRLLLVASLMAVMVAFYGGMFVSSGTSPYLFPSALGAILLTIIFDAPIAFLFTVALSLIVGALTGNDYFALLAVFFPAFISVYAVLRVRTRVQIMRSSLLIFIGFLAVILVQAQFRYQLNAEVFQSVLYAGVNALATPLVALGLLIGIESVFGVTTDLTLLEISDLNRPLLKQLSLKAPGTYHHSILVGSLAEAAAEAIDANPLLVRAGAYYHDIGKMRRREYFIENQTDSQNIHDSLTPEESAKYLSAHVVDGVKIANEYHLPEAVKAFIREHHGTSLMAFFYEKALEENPGHVDEAQFRYPGPKPQSKETGILMLADSAEAAVRSADNPTPETIRKVVRSIVINKYRDEELDECPLTLRDLRLIIEAFLPILEGMHHHRIKYPERDDDEEEKPVTSEGEDQLG